MSVVRILSSARAPVQRWFGRRTPHTVAAVDLGSNSFHMIVARIASGQFHVVDRLQEMVRLGAGLDRHDDLDKLARARALECLARFGERLRGMAPGSVRAVGTNTLRRARNSAKFLAAAERALGHPIEIVSGQEEARLIYQGVVHELPDDEHRRLVVDVGGGSTEFIIGRRHEPLLAESLHMGCVDTSRRYFGDGRITAKRWRQAETAAHLELQPVESAFRRRGWEQVFGSSGTVRAVGAVLSAQGWSGGDVTLPALERLRERLFATAEIERISLAGLNRERTSVFPGGVAILIATFEALKIERMDVSDSALREGVLYDLLGRIRHSDARAHAVKELSERYQLDVAQAGRVERTATYCLAKLARAWDFGAPQAQALAFAARLHEIGLAIAHSKYHRHGAYLVAHSDLPGFSWQEQSLLAILIDGHRRRFPTEALAALPREERRTARRLTLLLRLAVLLHRGRADVELPRFRLKAGKHLLTLRFPRGWLKKNPLTRADLAREAEYLKAAKWKLDFA